MSVARREILPFLVLLLLVTLMSGYQPTPTNTPVPPTVTAAPTLPPPTPSPTREAPSSVEVALQHIQRLEDGTVLARVNGEPIEWTEYELVLLGMLHTIDRQSPVNWSDPAMQQRLGSLQNQALEQAVDRRILCQMAAKQGVTVDESVVQTEIDGQKSQILQSGQYTDWDDFLEKNNLTQGSFEQTIRDSLLLSALLTVQEVETQSEQVNIAHIVVTDEAKAQEVAAKLQSGEEFAALAAEYSEDEQTKNTGGDLGWFAKETLLPELVGPAYELPIQGVSEPIATQYGYVIIKVLGREMRDDEVMVIRRRQQQVLSAQLATARASAQIEYLVDFEKSQAGP
jgi:parvulin-like peptidyl-prolyl isomerase